MTTATMTHTPETIKAILEKGDALSNMAVEKALLVLYARQTQDEQITQSTSQVNGRGFNAFDAEILSSFACQVESKKGAGRKLGECLTEKQMILARKKVVRYVRQLAEVANEKAQASSPKKEEVKEVGKAFWSFYPELGWTKVDEGFAWDWYYQTTLEASQHGEPLYMSPFGNAPVGTGWVSLDGSILVVTTLDYKPEIEPLSKEVEQAFNEGFDAWQDSVHCLDTQVVKEVKKTPVTEPQDKDFQAAKNKISAWLNK